MLENKEILQKERIVLFVSKFYSFIDTRVSKASFVKIDIKYKLFKITLKQIVLNI
jgi:hypothetical protein